jgi:phosphoribosylaminoimidazole (AIR) synthetase
MKDITGFRMADGTAEYSVWKDRENPTHEELHRPNSVYTVVTVFPHNTIDALKHMTKDKIQEFLNSFIPKKPN